MNVQKALLLIMAAIFLTVAEAATIQFKNLCPFPVWPSAITPGGNGPRVPATLIVLPNNYAVIEVPNNWTNGRVWGRTSCGDLGPGDFICSTGNCGTISGDCTDIEPTRPVTFMEFTLNGPGGIDSYLISHADGFNLPVSITPLIHGTGISATPPMGNCSVPSCVKSLNRICPPELSAVKTSKGHVLCCDSPCDALKTDENCCTGKFATRESCPPTDQMRLFTQVCPQAHVYPFDVNDTTFTCPTGKDYLITFCPDQ